MNRDTTLKVENIKTQVAMPSTIITKEIIAGKYDDISIVVVYSSAIVNKNIIDIDILKPLMLYAKDDFSKINNIAQYINSKYIMTGDTQASCDINFAIEGIKKGKTVIFIENCNDFIVVNSIGGESRAIAEPNNEFAIRGSREGFVENIEININILKRRLKDKNLTVDTVYLGKRTQTETAIIYVKDIAEPKIVDQLKKDITQIDVDKILATGVIEQFIEKYPYSFFPQTYGTERPDKIVAGILEGRIAIILDGVPYVIMVPATLFDFFQGVEEYYERTILANFIRILRIIAVLIVITLPSIYLTILKFNGELIPIKFIFPIVQSRIGIALTPFLEILSMELVVEFLREGGLRLPSKIAQTLSLVGGIIIGDAALKAKVVSPSTLLIVGISVVATFVITNYEMSISLRLVRFPMLIAANILGSLGIIAGLFIIVVHLCSMETYGVPYFAFYKKDLKDTLLRAPLYKMNERPEIIPARDNIRQKDFRNKIEGEEDE